MDRYGFIGCGNMGSALIRAAVKAEKAENIYITDVNREKAGALASETGAVSTDIGTVASSCRYIFLGVKPQMMEGMLKSIEHELAERKQPLTLITMAAGLPIEKIDRMAAGSHTVIRMMPNLAASVGEAMILYASENASEEELKAFTNIMRYAGRLSFMDEKLIDAGSAISGCGPAYIFMFIEAMADAGVRAGLPRAMAQELAAQTVLGSARLLMETGKHPGEMKDAVCSPGGTTIAGVLSLEKNAFRSTVSEAVTAAYARTLELK